MKREIRHHQTAIVTAGIVGLAVGDALGVPVEFQSRRRLARDPVTNMRSGGVHRQLAGTWSDDTSLVLCLVESICEAGIDHVDQSARFVDWLYRAHWTPRGDVFDVGLATSKAIRRLSSGVAPMEAGLSNERSCGNGSLMRILPLALYLAYVEPSLRIQTVMDCSRLTHRHVRCQIACAFFVEIGAAIVWGAKMKDAISLAQSQIKPLIEDRFPAEKKPFGRLLGPNLETLDRSEVSGSGYVIDCLEASLWCALQADSYRDGVLAAVNLGEDTDTTGAVTGGLLGLRFGIDDIPVDWKNIIARSDDVMTLSERFRNVCWNQWQLDC